MDCQRRTGQRMSSVPESKDRRIEKEWGRQTKQGKRSTQTARFAERLREGGAGRGPTGMGRGPPTSNLPTRGDKMLLYNLRARPTAPFCCLWATSVEIPTQKGGGLMMRTGALEAVATPHRPNASQCVLPTPPPSSPPPSPTGRLTAAVRPLLPVAFWSRTWFTPGFGTPEIGEVPGAARDFRPRSLASRAARFDGGR